MWLKRRSLEHVKSSHRVEACVITLMTSDNGFPAGSSHQTTKDFALSAPAGRIKCRLALKRIKNTVERIDSVLGLHSQKKKYIITPLILLQGVLDN